MAAITIDTDRHRVGEPIFVGSCPVAATTDIPAGALMGIGATGYAVNMSAAAGLKCLGVATKRRDNDPGSAAALTIPYECGAFAFDNSAAADEVLITDVMTQCYAVDNNTVAKTSNSGARSLAGTVVGLLGTKVLVMVGIAAPPLIQRGRGTLVAGVLTVNSGIHVTTDSYVIAMRMTEAGTDGDELRCPTADRTIGLPGTGAITIRAFLNGVAATSDTSTIEYIIVG